MRTSRCTSWVSKTQRNQRPSCQHSMDHGESKGVPKKQSTSASWVMLKPLCDHNKLWKILRDGDTRPPYLSPEKPVCRSRSNRTGHETTDWFPTGNGYDKAGYHHPPYLTSMQSTSCEMPGWMNHMLESRLQGKNINNFRHKNDTILMAESEEELKCILMKAKKESEKAGLKLSIQKMRIMGSSLITS